MSQINNNRVYFNNKVPEIKINIFRNGLNIYNSNSFNKNNKEEIIIHFNLKNLFYLKKNIIINQIVY
jgi:hypothetical protein